MSSTRAGPRANRDAVARFIAMTRKAKEILATSDAEWEKIAPLTGATDAATLRVYRDRYREGIPRRPIADEEADARVLYRVLARSAAANWSDRRRARSRHVLSRHPRRLRCCVSSRFLVFLATWWIAALFVGEAKLPAPPAVLDGDHRGSPIPARCSSISARRWRAWRWPSCWR